MSTKELLTEEQVRYVSGVLEEKCAQDASISKADLFKAVQNRLDRDVALYQFVNYLTHAIRDNRFPGFKTVVGRRGGICRGDSQVSRRCLVSVNDIEVPVQKSEKTVTQLLVNVFNATYTTSEKGDVIVNNRHYKLNNTPSTKDILLNLLYKN